VLSQELGALIMRKCKESVCNLCRYESLHLAVLLYVTLS